jgi:Mg-chelatase subunit ChlD
MKFSCSISSRSLSRFFFLIILFFSLTVFIASCGGGGNSNDSEITDETSSNDGSADDVDSDDGTNTTSDQSKLSVSINSIDLDDCPNVKIYMTVADDANKVIQNDPALTVKIFEDAVEQTDNFSTTWMDGEKAPIAVVLAMDYSLSMSDRSIEAMENAVKNFVNGMKPEDKAAIIKFYYEPQQMIGLTSDKDSLIAAIDQAPNSRDYTNIYDTVYDAVDLAATSIDLARPAVILLTDGAHYLIPQYPARYTLDEAIANAKANKVAVSTIAFNLKNATEIMTIADETGGLYFSTYETSALNDIYSSLFEYFESQHVMVYTSKAADDLEHSLRIEAEYNGLLGDSIIQNFMLCPAVQ